jgi:hypothetical protein
VRVGGGRRGEEGAATAELAVALPTLVLVLAVSLAALDLGIAQVRCVDAARVGARLLARGEPAGPALEEVRAAAPRGARVAVGTAEGRVTVTVTGSVPRLLAPLRGPVAPRASAVALVEDAP